MRLKDRSLESEAGGDLIPEDKQVSHSYNQGLLERLMFRVARKWVAGNSIDEAMEAARNSNSQGMLAILNFLGEDTTEKSLVDIAVKEYSDLMDCIHSDRINGCVSIKPTQLGLMIDYDLCLQNFKTLAKKAKGLGQFLWVDMESVKFTEDTITIYLDLVEDGYETGIAIQAYLKRSASDLLHIIESGKQVTVRLVKGAYDESNEDAFESKEQVDRNYSKLMRMLFESKANVAIATHDSKLVEEAILLSSETKMEFQLLMGIRDGLKKDLLAKGMKVSEYIPYGAQWLPYSVRRIRERKRNLLLLARSLVQE